MADILVVQSKVKELVKKAGCNCAGDVAAALSEQVAAAIKAGIVRAKANKRKTVKGIDV